MPRSMSVEIQELLFIVYLGCQIEEEDYNICTISQAVEYPGDGIGLVWVLYQPRACIGASVLMPSMQGRPEQSGI